MQFIVFKAAIITHLSAFAGTTRRSQSLTSVATKSNKYSRDGPATGYPEIRLIGTRRPSIRGHGELPHPSILARSRGSSYWNGAKLGLLAQGLQQIPKFAIVHLHPVIQIHGDHHPAGSGKIAGCGRLAGAGCRFCSQPRPVDRQCSAQPAVRPLVHAHRDDGAGAGRAGVQPLTRPGPGSGQAVSAG